MSRKAPVQLSIPLESEPAQPPARRKGGRPSLPDTRRHQLRIRCNDDELLKFRVLSELNHGLNISTMARDIILDELNAMLSECPRNKLLALLQSRGLSPTAIEALLKTL